MSVKHLLEDSNSKSSTLHPGGARSTLSPTLTTDNCKDGLSGTKNNSGSSERQIVAKEEKSCSSSHSHTNNQCYIDQPENMVLFGKENSRSTSGSRSLNKIEATTKHCKSDNGLSSGVHRETELNKCICMTKTPAVDKVPHSPVDVSIQESYNHKLVVKIPNGGQGSAESVVGFLQGSSCRNSRASSLAISEKFDQSNAFVRGNKHDYHQVQEFDGSLTFVQQKISESKRSHDVLKSSCSPSRNQIKSRKTHDSSFSSTNSLVECFPKISEAVNTCAGDDGEVNVLASIVTKEISKLLEI